MPVKEKFDEFNTELKKRKLPEIGIKKQKNEPTKVTSGDINESDEE
jgi:hypothetical protein